MWSAQTILPIDELPAGAPVAFAAVQPNFHAYGLGWMLRDYRGRKMVYHTGTLAGYVSRTTLIPELKLGVVVLTNQEEDRRARGDRVHRPRSLPGRARGRLGRRRCRDLAKVEAAEARSEGGARPPGQRNANSRPSLPLAELRRPVSRPLVRRRRRSRSAPASSPSPSPTRKQLTGDLEHWQYDTFVARWRDRTLDADAYVTFSLKPDGSIEEAKMQPVSPLTDFSFDFQDLDLRRVR